MLWDSWAGMIEVVGGASHPQPAHTRLHLAMQPSADVQVSVQTDLARRVVASCQPEHGESLTGFVLRVRQENIFLSNEWQVALLRTKVTSSKVFHPSVGKPLDLDRIAYALRCSRAEIDPLTYPFTGVGKRRFYAMNGHQLRDADISQASWKVCPACLAHYGFCQSVWEIALFVACPEHACLLISACPSCHVPLSLRRPGPGICTCEAPLSDAPPTQCSPELAELMWFIAASVGYERGPRATQLLPSQLSLLEPVTLLRTILFLGRAALNIAGDVRRGRRLTIDDWAALTQASAVTLCGWPSGFHAFMDGLSARAGDLDASDSVQSTFKFAHPTTARQLGVASFVHEEMAAYIARHWRFRSFNGRRHGSTGLFTVDGQTFLDIKRAMKALRCGEPDLKRLVRAGILRTLSAPPRSRTAFLVEYESLQECQKRRASLLTAKDVRHYLHISYRTVVRLKKLRVLSPASDAKQYGGEGEFDREDVQRFAALFGLGTSVPEVRELTRREITWTRIERGSRRFRRDWRSTTIRLIQDGRVRVSARLEGSKGLGGAVFPVSLLDHLVSKERLTRRSQFLSLHQVAKALQCNYSNVLLFAHNNHLRTFRHPFARSWRAATPAAVKQFKERYVLGREIARQLGVPFRTLKRMLAAVSIHPLPSANGHTCYYYSRCQIRRATATRKFSAALKGARDLRQIRSKSERVKPRRELLRRLARR